MRYLVFFHSLKFFLAYDNIEQNRDSNPNLKFKKKNRYFVSTFVVVIKFAINFITYMTKVRVNFECKIFHIILESYICSPV